jgi:hypothetical protein
MEVFLVALGGGRFEVYAEPPDELPETPGHEAGRVRRWLHRAQLQWRDWVDIARRGESQARLARWRDATICHLAESMAEQRTLWALRKAQRATLRYPSSISREQARQGLDAELAASRKHHGLWLAFDTLLFIASGILFFVPGPNVVAYYLAFRVLSHGQSYLGASRGLTRVAWTLVADDVLAELAGLVSVPHAARASRVSAIAEQLSLHRFAVYFERIAR